MHPQNHRFVRSRFRHVRFVLYHDPSSPSSSAVPSPSECVLSCHETIPLLNALVVISSPPFHICSFVLLVLCFHYMMWLRVLLESKCKSWFDASLSTMITLRSTLVSHRGLLLHQLYKIKLIQINQGNIIWWNFSWEKLLSNPNWRSTNMNLRPWLIYDPFGTSNRSSRGAIDDVPMVLFMPNTNTININRGNLVCVLSLLIHVKCIRFCCIQWCCNEFLVLLLLVWWLALWSLQIYVT